MGVLNGLTDSVCAEELSKEAPKPLESVESAECVSLKEYFQADFRIGAAVSPFQLHSTNGRETQVQHILKHFNSLTAENCMKPEAIYRGDGEDGVVCDFSAADALVEFARQNGMAVRGHTLVWHSQTPKEFFLDAEGKPLEKEALYARLERYISAVLTHFKGKIYCWDVVNEAIAGGGPEIYRTQSPWYRACGKEFIAQAFRIAHKIDPDVKLYFNDYGLLNPQKREKTLTMLRELLEAGVPIHGVGMQGHWNMHTFSAAELQKSIEAFSALGLEVQITELDLSVWQFQRKGSQPQSNEFTPEMAQKQAETYAEIFEVLRRNSDKISSVTFWGVSDRFTWLSRRAPGGKDYPLLFDADFAPKPAFHRVVTPEKP